MNRASRLKFSFAVVALVLIVSSVITYWMGALTVQKNQFVLQQRETIDILHDFLSTLKDAETGQRGFLLTGDENYLRPYTQAASHISASFTSLKTRAEAGDLKPADVAELERLSSNKLAELQFTINMQRTGQGNVLEAVASDQGKKLMDDIRAKIASITSVEENALAAASHTADQYNLYRSIVFIVAAAINLAFLNWAYRRIVDEQERREAAGREVQQQKNLLAVTLASIGDAVIVTDTSANITFMNEVAEQLTGWNVADALGQPCSKIFNIINEDTRHPVDSPVAKVLQLGTIVGLANHTLLLRRDGTEIPIDDSGAPIREPDGSLRGVVLVFRDFTEYKASQSALIHAKNEAERANRAKDQFLAMLSHELRTPLTPVLATLMTWETNPNFSPEFIADVQMVRRNVEMEARLIDDLLDLTRIAKDKLSLTLETADINELIESVTGMFSSDVNAKSIKLSVSLNAQRHHVRVDPGRVQQVFWNILKNATKFTPLGGSIHIQTTNENESLIITFTDTGIGIDADLLDRLFKPFQQGDGDLIRRAGGLGLGMAISKSLMDLHGGRISANSPGKGQGATFSITFPAAQSPPTDAPAQQVAVRPELHLKILLVEDHFDTANAMQRLLTTVGHSVDTADSIAAALDKTAAASYDLLLSDIGLPDGSGIDLIQKLRETSPIPAIALTGFGMDEDIARCKEAGFNGHITKPVNLQKLDQIIRQVIAKN